MGGLNRARKDGSIELLYTMGALLRGLLSNQSFSPTHPPTLPIPKQAAVRKNSRASSSGMYEEDEYKDDDAGLQAVVTNP